MSKPIEVEVLGIDRAAEWRRYVKETKQQLADDRETNLAIRDEARKAAIWGLGDRIYFLITQLPSMEGAPDRYRGEAISGLPDPSMSVTCEGTSPDDVIFEARHCLIAALSAAGVEKTWAECRARAAKATLEIADIRRL